MEVSITRILMITVFTCYCCSSTIADMACSESELVALESSGQLLPPQKLVERIEKDLKAIRAANPSTQQVNHQSPWTPGQLIVSDLEKSSADALNSSIYGPIQSKSIFQNTIFLVTFTKPYHPVRLAEHLEKEFRIENAQPNGSYGRSSSITLTEDANGDNTYVFYSGSGDCPSGCINKSYSTYKVTPNGKVTSISNGNPEVQT